VLSFVSSQKTFHSFFNQIYQYITYLSDRIYELFEKNDREIYMKFKEI
jgi:hypothetical protein